MNIVGKIKKEKFVTETWAILTENGQVYELKGISPELQQVGIEVEIEGKIRDDMMTLAMIGPVFEIESYRILN